jgi:serine protease
MDPTPTPPDLDPGGVVVTIDGEEVRVSVTCPVEQLDGTDVPVASLIGTSMAAPHVAGVAALILQGTPAASPAASPTAVTDAIVATATTGKVTSAGSGSPNRLLFSGETGGGDTGGGTPPSTGGITLDVSTSKVRGSTTANLSWSGASGSVDVYRGGSIIATVSGTSYADNLGKSSGTLTYEVCNAGTTTCSNSVTITY